MNTADVVTRYIWQLDRAAACTELGSTREVLRTKDRLRLKCKAREQPAVLSLPLPRSSDSSQNHYFETTLLANQAFSFSFKTVNIYFASHSPLTALAAFILPWEFTL